ncbi:glycosyltransferase family 2 protein [Proteus penneri]|uniref:glycosyltransferase family 2 protein n=1 Tax=Proteus penneri TaxID=102862 RepID=UPI001EFBF066|nr:glycosyltransferase family A protein [Proteus penneri]
MGNNKLGSITVIIPYFNADTTIERALTSVSQQTLLPESIIILNDASTLQSTQQLNHIVQEKFSTLPINIIEMKDNVGPAKLRNIGWNLSNTKYISFLDADDSWHPQKLEIQYYFFTKHEELDFIGHKMEIHKNNYIYDTILPPNKLKIKKINKRKILFKNYFNTPTVMLKRNILFRFNEDLRYSEDYALWLDIIYDNQKVAFIDTCLAYSHKSFYGISGLSSNLYKMEKGELYNFINLYKCRKINFFYLILAMSFSLIKYIKRILKTNLTKKKIK